MVDLNDPNVLLPFVISRFIAWKKLRVFASIFRQYSVPQDHEGQKVLLDAVKRCREIMRYQ